MSRLSVGLIIVFGLASGFVLANRLLESLAIGIETERTFLTTQVATALQPSTESSLPKQIATFQQRETHLENKLIETQQMIEATRRYREPIEREVTTYRMQFAERTRASLDEKLDLYIDLVSTYRDYQRAMSGLENFIPLEDGDSLLSVPSVQLDLVYHAGGSLAETHNRFVGEERDARFAEGFEQNLRQFLAPFKLETALVGCQATLCAVHLGNRWQDPYYRGFDELWDKLQQQSWFSLRRVGKAYEYRGQGRQVAVWYLEAPQ